jgi:hypothetical protein
MTRCGRGLLVQLFLITQNLVCDDYWSIKKVLFFCCVTVGEGYWSIKKPFFYSPVRANACHAIRADIQAPESSLAGKLLQRARMYGCISSSPKLCPCERGLLVDRKQVIFVYGVHHMTRCGRRLLHSILPAITSDIISRPRCCHRYSRRGHWSTSSFKTQDHIRQ